MRKYFLVTCCCIVNIVFGQKQGQELIDSLIKEIPNAKDDTATARLYKSIADKYVFINPLQARAFANKGMVLASKMKWNKGIAVFTSIIATIFNDAGNYDSAIFYNSKALTIHKKNNDQVNTASILNNMGVICQRQSKYTEATRYFFESLKAAEFIKNNKLIALTYNNIATVYFDQQDFKKAQEYNFKALSILEQEDNTEDIAVVLSSIANTYQETADSANAAVYYQRALFNYQLAENQLGIATVYTNLATLYKKDYNNKLNLALKAQAIWDTVNPAYILSIINTGNIGVAYLDIAKDSSGKLIAGKNIPVDKNEQLKKAIFYLLRAIVLSRSVGDINNEAFFTGNLAEAQALQGDYKNAYLNFRRYQLVQDSIYSQENKNKIATIEGQREVVLRDKEIAFKQRELANQQKLRWALIAGMALLLIIASLLFYQNKIRKKTNTTLLLLNNELDEANKVKAKFFGILSHDLRSPVANLINFLQLQKRNPGILNEQQIIDRENKISNSAESLLETMEGMLLWSKGQMENFKPEENLIPVANLFEYIKKFFAHTSNINFSFSDSDAVIVSTDEDYLQTIMQNLTANAVKALQQTPNATIEWKAWKEDGKTFLSVTDNGPGINSEQAKSLFDETHVTGTRHGLGLHIIRDLAKAIKCSISLQSTGNGTCFTLSF